MVSWHSTEALKDDWRGPDGKSRQCIRGGNWKVSTEIVRQRETRDVWIDPLSRVTVNRFSLTHNPELTHAGQSADRSGVSMSRFRRARDNGRFFRKCAEISRFRLRCEEKTRSRTSVNDYGSLPSEYVSRLRCLWSSNLCHSISRRDVRCRFDQIFTLSGSYTYWSAIPKAFYIPRTDPLAIATSHGSSCQQTSVRLLLK